MAPKKKQEKMSLGTFLGDQSLGSWADEMEDMPLPSSGQRTGYGNDSQSSYSPRPGYGDLSRFSERNYQPRQELPLPTKPPYTAHLGNLSFDATVADVEDFFADCSVTEVRIVTNPADQKPKGFGYVVFGTLDGLKKALEANGTQFQGRNVRISVAEPSKDRQEARELNDWTRKGPLPELPGGGAQRRTSDRPGYRNYDNSSDAGSERGGPRRNFSFETTDGKSRDFGNWERKGPLSPAAPPPNQMRDAGRIQSNERPFERKSSPAWGEGRSQDGSRPPRREFVERPAPERVPTAAELDNQWRSKMRPDAPVKSPTATPDVSMPSSPIAQTPSAPATRPKLNLQKRTVSEATGGEATPSPAGDSKASPFGAARPIDTAQREKEVEEKRVALRIKKEEEDKEKEKEKERKKEEEREKKRNAAEKAKGEAASGAATISNDNGKPSAGKEASSGSKDATAKENGTGAGKSYEILRRIAENENGDLDAEGDGEGSVAASDAPVNGVGAADGGKNVADTEPETPSAETPADDEGWETIQKPTRNRKQSGRPGRGVPS